MIQYYTQYSGYKPRVWTNKQTINQTNKQTNNQSNKQTNNQSIKQTINQSNKQTNMLYHVYNTIKQRKQLILIMQVWFKHGTNVSFTNPYHEIHLSYQDRDFKAYIWLLGASNYVFLTYKYDRKRQILKQHETSWSIRQQRKCTPLWPPRLARADRQRCEACVASFKVALHAMRQLHAMQRAPPLLLCVFAHHATTCNDRLNYRCLICFTYIT